MGSYSSDNSPTSLRSESKRSKSALIQVLGNNLLLYKPHPEQPKIVLPTAKSRGKDTPDKAVKRGTKPERR